MHDDYTLLEKLMRRISRTFSHANNLGSKPRVLTSPVTKIDRRLLRSTSVLLADPGLAQLTTSNFRDLTATNQSLARLVGDVTISKPTLSQVFAEHNALQASLESFRTQTSVTDLLSSIDMARLLHTSLSAQYHLPELEESSFGHMINASNMFSNDLEANFSKLTQSYREVIECIPSIAKPYVPLVAKYCPIEYSLEMGVLECTSLESDKEPGAGELPSVDEVLVSFDDRCLTLVNGAREALTSTNPDRARHVTTSLRELFRYVIHRLAPDDQVKKWSNDESHFHENRPTRRARLQYICRKVACDPLTEFIEDDVRAALTLMDLLHEGTHAVQSKLTDHQLAAIVQRMEYLILFLIKLDEKNRKIHVENKAPAPHSGLA